MVATGQRKYQCGHAFTGYARQDRNLLLLGNQSLLNSSQTCWSKLGSAVTLDLHAVQVQGFSDIAGGFTIPLFAEHYINSSTGPDVVSPKNSGAERARSLAEYLDALIVIIDMSKMMQTVIMAMYYRGCQR